MPPPPSFDYYAELQVERTASSNDITSAYRRLARIHHPDKNPDSQAEATLTFQRLQLAHETLSDPAKRARYDNPRPENWSSAFNQDQGDFWDDDEDDPFAYGPFSFPFPFPMNFFFESRFFRGPPRRSSSQGQAAYEDLNAANERRERENKRQEEVREMRRKEQRLRREAEEARQEAAEISKSLARLRQQEEESMKQEKRWTEIGAVSKDERLRTCLHSDLCNKVQHTKKFKCTACSAKRGMTAFECPHCLAFICQLCVTNSSERRKRLEVQEHMEETARASKDSNPLSCEPSFDKTDGNKPKAGNIAMQMPKTKPPKKTATDKSTKQPLKDSKSGTSGNTNKGGLERNSGFRAADEHKAAPTPASQFASGNPYGILAGSERTATFTSEKSVPDISIPDTPHGDVKIGNESSASTKPVQPKKKRQNKKVSKNDGGKENIDPAGKKQHAIAGVAVESKVINTSPDTHQNTAHPSSCGGPSSQNASANGIPNKTIKNGETNKATVKSPRSHSAPSLQQKSSGGGHVPTAGATGGYLRALNPNHRLTMGVLRQAMEKFGAVKSLKITNKKSGIAHVDFATHDGLCNAMVASPVAVSEQVTVRVVELNHCDHCGKAGHFAKVCREAKSKVQN
ncbi:hypothetical protein Daus18300_007419 [Diaporthe australafricana]|uniref:J domain-containing protein n=1 Tax=Diaporthe australafricana TaxID=127596 RepID=A0ABR3WN37_9PEZI